MPAEMDETEEMVNMVLQVLRESKVLLEHKECRDLRVLLAHQVVLLAPKALLVPLVHRENRVHLVQ